MLLFLLVMLTVAELWVVGSMASLTVCVSML